MVEHHKELPASNSGGSIDLLLETTLSIDETMLGELDLCSKTKRRQKGKVDQKRKSYSASVPANENIPDHVNHQSLFHHSQHIPQKHHHWHREHRTDSKSQTDLEDNESDDEDDEEVERMMNEIFRHVDSIPDFEAIYCEEHIEYLPEEIVEDDEEYGFYDECEETTHSRTTSFETLTLNSTLNRTNTNTSSHTLSSSTLLNFMSPSSLSSNGFWSMMTSPLRTSNRNSANELTSSSGLVGDATATTANTTARSSYSDFTLSPLKGEHDKPCQCCAQVCCVLEEHKTSLTCRSFPMEVSTAGAATASASTPNPPSSSNRHRANSSHLHVDVCLSIAGIRIVHDLQYPSVDIAEYKVQLHLNGEVYSTWKRYEDFQMVALACQEYKQRRDQEVAMLRTRQRQMYTIDPDSIPFKPQAFTSRELQDTLEAWQEVVAHRPYWFKPSNYVAFIYEESELLQEFMKHLLFEIPNVRMLLEFIL